MNKQILLLMLVSFALLIAMTGAQALSCYQESAKVFNQSGTDNCSGLTYNGNYGQGDNAFNDGDWNTWAHAGSGTDWYINYSKPAFPVTNALWRVKIDGSDGIYNLSAHGCNVNAYDDTLKVYVYRRYTGLGGDDIECWNGTSWHIMGTINHYENYEEAVIWQTSYNSVENISACSSSWTDNTAYILQNDINFSGGNCFGINATNIALNLNGYTITGDDGYNAVDISGNDNIQVFNGIISAGALSVDWTLNSKFYDLYLIGNSGAGVWVGNANYTSFDNISGSGNSNLFNLYDNPNYNNFTNINASNSLDNGIYIEAGTNNYFENLFILGSSPDAFYSISSSNNTIKNSYISTGVDGGRGIVFDNGNYNVIDNTYASSIDTSVSIVGNYNEIINSYITTEDTEETYGIVIGSPNTQHGTGNLLNNLTLDNCGIYLGGNQGGEEVWNTIIINSNINVTPNPAYAIFSEFADYTLIENNNLSCYGVDALCIDLTEGYYSNVSNNKILSDSEDVSMAVYLYGGANNLISGNEISGFFKDAGIFIDIYSVSENFTIDNNNVDISVGANIGSSAIITSNSLNNNITNNNITTNNIGIYIDATSNVLLENNYILLDGETFNDGIGINLVSNADNVLISNNEIDMPVYYEGKSFVSWAQTTNVVFENLLMQGDTSSINASFFANDNSIMSISDVSNPLGNPVGFNNLSAYLTINGEAGDWLMLDINYDDTLLPNEESLRIYKYDTDTWDLDYETYSNNYGVDTTNNIVYANLTSFSTFAPLEEAIVYVYSNYTYTELDGDISSQVTGQVTGYKSIGNFFPTFIVLGSLIVLILITIIIINAIRSSGVLGDSGA